MRPSRLNIRHRPSRGARSRDVEVAIPDLPLTNLAFWIDATDAATITASSGNVTAWNDKSGNARHLSSVIGTPRTGDTTRNGRNVIDFDGTEALFRTTAFFDALASATVYAAISTGLAAGSTATIVAEGRVALNTPFSQPLRIDATGGNSLNVFRRNDASALTPNQYFSGVDVPRDNQMQIIACRWTDGGTAIPRVNGVDGTPSGTVGSGSITLDRFAVGALIRNAGVEGGFPGSIGEVLIYSGVQSLATVGEVEAYLNARWR